MGLFALIGLTKYYKMKISQLIPIFIWCDYFVYKFTWKICYSSFYLVKLIMEKNSIQIKS